MATDSEDQEPGQEPLIRQQQTPSPVQTTPSLHSERPVFLLSPSYLSSTNFSKSHIRDIYNTDDKSVSLADTSPELNKTQPRKAPFRRFQTQWLRLLADTWFVEIVASVFSLAFLVAIISILFYYDGRALPEFAYGITVGTIIAILTTCLTASIMVSVSHGISQLKWLSFADSPRKANHFELYDEASRGTWGSICLILSPARSGISSLGALITIFILVAQAITQQSLTYQVHHVNDPTGVALAPRSNFFDAVDPDSPKLRVLDPVPVDASTKAAFFAGILNKKEAVPYRHPLCSSGNCTWEPYKTLAVCSSIKDMSDSIKKKSIDTGPVDYLHGWTQMTRNVTVELPGVMTLNISTEATIGAMAVRSTGKLKGVPAMNTTDHNKIYNAAYNGANVTSKAFGHLQSSTIADFYVMWDQAKAWNATMRSFDLLETPPTPKALEINLHFCVQTLQTNVTDGVAHTKETRPRITGFEYRPHARFRDYYAPIAEQMHNADWPSPNMTAVLPGQDGQFLVSRRAQQALLWYTRTLFAGRFDASEVLGTEAVYGSGVAVQPLADLLRKKIFDATETDQEYHWAMSDDNYMEKFSKYAENLARTLSNSMREESPSNLAATGHALGVKTFVHVTWGWITAVVVLEAASLVFLAIVIFMNKSRENKLWRSSNIALLQALDQSARPEGASGIYGAFDMEQYARTVDLQLIKQDDVWKLADAKT